MKFIAVARKKEQVVQLADTLKAMGCSIDRVLKITGVITGDSQSLALKALKIPGIKSVEADGIKRSGR